MRHKGGVLSKLNGARVVGVAVAPVVEDVEELGRGLDDGRLGASALRGNVDGAVEGVGGDGGEEVGLEGFVNVVEIGIRIGGGIGPCTAISLRTAAWDIDGGVAVDRIKCLIRSCFVNGWRCLQIGIDGSNVSRECSLPDSVNRTAKNQRRVSRATTECITADEDNRIRDTQGAGNVVEAVECVWGDGFHVVADGERGYI